MKNEIVISTLCICTLFTASGCGAGAENESPVNEGVGSTVVSESVESAWQEQTKPAAVTDGSAAGNETEPTVSTESAQEEPTKHWDSYEELIAAVREAVRGDIDWESEEDHGFSYVYYYYSPYYDAASGKGYGYLLKDIDGNGTDELILGVNDEPGTAADGILYDLYTISDGEVVHVFCGGEHDNYSLCENGMIAREADEGAPTGLNAYYTLEGTELHLTEAVIYNGWVDEREDPWFYSTQYDSIQDAENAEPIGAEQARTIMEKYVYEHPTFILFAEE